MPALRGGCTPPAPLECVVVKSPSPRGANLGGAAASFHSARGLFAGGEGSTDLIARLRARLVVHSRCRTTTGTGVSISRDDVAPSGRARRGAERGDRPA